MTRNYRRSGRTVVSAMLFAATTGTLAGTGPHLVATAPATVEIDRFQFQPQELTVKPGTTVVWLNRDQTIHNVVMKDGKLASPGLDTDDRYSVVFDREGEYSYYCGLHPNMVGVVHVRGP